MLVTEAPRKAWRWERAGWGGDRCKQESVQGSTKATFKESMEVG